MLIVAHGNSLRALVMYLDRVSESDILELNIPTGAPLVYELDGELRALRHHYLGDPEKVAAAAARVASQASSVKKRAGSPEANQPTRTRGVSLSN